jgi:hypothetical protein
MIPLSLPWRLAENTLGENDDGLLPAGGGKEKNRIKHMLNAVIAYNRTVRQIAAIL